jgi:hypothetical protein
MRKPGACGLRPERQLDILAAAEQLGLNKKGGAAGDAVGR